MLNNSIRPFFEDTKSGFAKQILHIALCESNGKDERDTIKDEAQGIYTAANYFKSSSNFELTVDLIDAWNEKNAKTFFDQIRNKITTKDLTDITFKEYNQFFFVPDGKKIGFVAY
jgi:hypothetical protein